ncbi:hypothetical protein B0T42_12530 [Rathayibacter sp. VKM Ac-2630]|nr:hypothetical protein B0T42_12530 [Rathayibacter sp. VKM Ac-2630]
MLTPFGEKPAPTVREMIELEAFWPDRSRRMRVDGELLTHDEVIRNRWGLSETRYRQLLFHALGYRMQECLDVNAEVTYRLLAVAARQKNARATRTVAGLR